MNKKMHNSPVDPRIGTEIVDGIPLRFGPAGEKSGQTERADFTSNLLPGEFGSLYPEVQLILSNPDWLFA
jgi:hypothetical protein